MGRLAASVAHEIRNPLTAINMRVFSLQRALGEHPLYEDDLRVISEEIARLERVVRNFMDFSRPPTLQPGKFDSCVLIDKSLELLKYRIQQHNVGVTVNLPETLPAIRVDEDQFKQVCINLIINAIECMTDGGTLQIDAGENAADEFLCIRFRDSGSGVPDDMQARVFEPFVSMKEEGTGLGLPIAAKIMARHGGRLELLESSDQGTVFQLWAPLAEDDADGQDTGRR